MREAQLLAPSRTLPRAENPHTGTIVTERPNEVWASDHTLTAHRRGRPSDRVRGRGSRVLPAVAVPALRTAWRSCVGLHAANCGGFRTGAAAGIRNRHDHGSQYQYMSDDYQAEIAFLGMESSPSFVRQPECNGCVERFIRTLKEQLLWVKVFQNVEELRWALAEFRERYNQRWIVQRLGYLTPAQARQQLLALGAAA